MEVRDLPDYTREMIIKYTGGFIGLEELAARLRSPVPWDMRGNVVFIEDFESELTEWELGPSGSGCTAARTGLHKFLGDWSLKMYKAAGAAKEVQIYRSFHYPGAVKYGAFARFAWDADLQIFTLRVDFLDGSDNYVVLVSYNLTTTTLSVFTTGEVLTPVDSALTIGCGELIFYPVLVTFDLESGLYDKLYFADQEYDISSVAIYSEPSTEAPMAEVTLGLDTDGAGDFTVYCDGVIITKNMP